MCGICGLVSFSGEKRFENMCSMLRNLRHRGYDSWGLSQYETFWGNGTPVTNTSIRTQRYASHVPSDTRFIGVFDHSHSISAEDKGKMSLNFSIGHTRYTTKGSHQCHSQAQPLISDDGGIALVHNGQVECHEEGSDTKHILKTLQEAVGRHADKTENWVEHVFQEVFVRLDGSYACLALIENIGLVAFRDLNGTRPLCMAGTEDGGLLFASESSAFGELEHIQESFDIKPGEVVLIGERGNVECLNLLGTPFPANPCLFEFIYLAHDDSVIDGISVKGAREEMGRLLAPKVDPLNVDVIVPVPHTPLLAGKILGDTLGIECVDLLQARSLKSRRESRTFILPTQRAREQAVSQKFAVRTQAIEKCKGKRLLILDDSIVRGTTLKHVVSLIKKTVKPSELFVASLSPPIVKPNKFGIDIPDTKLLIAAERDINTMRGISNMVAERLFLDHPVVYQSLNTLVKGLRNLVDEEGKIESFEKSVFFEKD